MTGVVIGEPYLAVVEPSAGVSYSVEPSAGVSYSFALAALVAFGSQLVDSGLLEVAQNRDKRKEARKTREYLRPKTRDPGNKDFADFGSSADVSVSAARGASTASDNLAAHDFRPLGLGLR